MEKLFCFLLLGGIFAISQSDENRFTLRDCAGINVGISKTVGLNIADNTGIVLSFLDNRKMNGDEKSCFIL